MIAVFDSIIFNLRKNINDFMAIKKSFDLRFC